MTLAWYPDSITQDLARATQLTLLWGFDGLVLRTIDGGRVPDVNVPKLKYRLELDDLDVVAVEPGLFEGEAHDRAGWLGDLTLLDDSLRFCRQIGCTTILTGSLPGDDLDRAADALARAAHQAARVDIEIAVRNEGAGRTEVSDLSTLVESLGAPSIRVCWDPVISKEAGDDLLESVDVLVPHLGMLHVRGSEIGEASVDWGGLLGRLLERGYNGPVVMDATGLGTREALRRATDLIYAFRGALKSNPD